MCSLFLQVNKILNYFVIAYRLVKIYDKIRKDMLRI